MADEKIVKLKLPHWYRRIIIQIADNPDATFQEDNYTVYRKLEDAQVVVDGKVYQAFDGKVKSHTRVRLDPPELEWAHDHYNSELDRIVIPKSMAKHIWMKKQVDKPAFRVEVAIRSTFIEHEGKTYTLRDNQTELAFAVMSPPDFTSSPSLYATTNVSSIRYRLIRLGVAIPISSLNKIYDVHFQLMPMIHQAIASGKLWECIDKP